MSEHDDNAPQEIDPGQDFLASEEASNFIREDPIRIEIWTFMHTNSKGQTELCDQIEKYISNNYWQYGDLFLDANSFLLLACEKLFRSACLPVGSRNDGMIRKGFRSWTVYSEAQRKARLANVELVTGVSVDLQLNIWDTMRSDTWAEAQRLGYSVPIGESGGLTEDELHSAYVGQDAVSMRPKPEKKVLSKTEAFNLPPTQTMHVPESPPLVRLSPQELSAEFKERLALIDNLLETVDEPDRAMFRRIIELRIEWSLGNEDMRTKKGKEENTHKLSEIRRSLKKEFGLDAVAVKKASLRLDEWVWKVRVWEDAKRYREFGLSMDAVVSRITSDRFAEEYECERRALIVSGLTPEEVTIKLAHELETIRLRVVSVCPAVLKRWGDPANQKTGGIAVK